MSWWSFLRKAGWVGGVLYERINLYYQGSLLYLNVGDKYLNPKVRDGSQVELLLLKRPFAKRVNKRMWKTLGFLWEGELPKSLGQARKGEDSEGRGKRNSPPPQISFPASLSPEWRPASARGWGLWSWGKLCSMAGHPENHLVALERLSHFDYCQCVSDIDNSLS